MFNSYKGHREVEQKRYTCLCYKFAGKALPLIMNSSMVSSIATHSPCCARLYRAKNQNGNKLMDIVYVNQSYIENSSMPCYIRNRRGLCNSLKYN